MQIYLSFLHEYLASFLKQVGVNFGNDRLSIVSCRIRIDRMAIVRCRFVFLGFDWFRSDSIVTYPFELAWWQYIYCARAQLIPKLIKFSPSYQCPVQKETYRCRQEKLSSWCFYSEKRGKFHKIWRVAVVTISIVFPSFKAFTRCDKNMRHAIKSRCVNEFICPTCDCCMSHK